jgi:hypothetical protein
VDNTLTLEQLALLATLNVLLAQVLLQLAVGVNQFQRQTIFSQDRLVQLLALLLQLFLTQQILLASLAIIIVRPVLAV